MDIKKIGTIEAIFCVLVVITNKIILNLPKMIIQTCGSNAWLNVIYISVIAILFTLLISKLFKRFESYDIFEISNYVGGRFLKLFISIGFILTYLLISSIVLRDFSENLKLIYYTKSPLIYIMLFFLVGAVLGNKMGFRTMIKTNLIIMPIVIFSIFLILVSSFKNFTPELIFPVMGNGINTTFISGLSNLFSFSGLSYLFVMMPYLKNPKKFKKISIISIVISSIYLFLSVLCILLVFPYITVTEESMSIYLLTRTIEYGHFIQRIDALFILLFIMACLSYLTITLFIILDIFKRITEIEDSKAMSYCFAVLILGLSLIPKKVSEIRLINLTIFKYSVLIFFVISLLILFIANIKKKKENKIT